MPEHRRQFLSEARQRLLHRLMSVWQRRGADLLQIGLNAGFSPEFFWEAGFDVTAVDASPACLAAAKSQTGPKIEYACAHAEALPFEDGNFDYAVLMHPSFRFPREGRPRSGKAAGGRGPGLSGAAFSEALRVASRGIILVDWNRFSLAGVPRNAEERWAQDDAVVSFYGPGAGGVTPWEVYGMARRACPGRRISLMSALPLWEQTWPDGAQGVCGTLRRALAPFNLFPLPLPVGALVGVRVDWAPVPLTPVGMLRSAASSLCPARIAREEVMGRDGAGR